MNYVIKSDVAGTYYIVEEDSWTDDFSKATVFGELNLMRFAVLRFVNKSWGSASFRRVVPMQAKIGLMEKIGLVFKK